MVGDLAERQHRRDAGLGALEDGRPLVARAGGERGGEPLPQLRPARDVVLRRQVGVGSRPSPSSSCGVELRLQRRRRRRAGRPRRCRCRSTGAPPSSRLAARLVGPVTLCRRSAQVICMSRLAPSTIAASTTWPRPERCASQQRREHADEQQHRAAAEVADEVQRRHRPLAGPADGVQRAGERDVVDVVARRAAPSARPGPSRSSGRRPAAGCGRGSRPARRPSRSATPGR